VYKEYLKYLENGDFSLLEQKTKALNNSLFMPYVVEKTGYGERHYDIFSRLLKDRIIFIGSTIEDTLSNLVIAQILFLQNENKNQDINVCRHFLFGSGIQYGRYPYCGWNKREEVWPASHTYYASSAMGWNEGNSN